MVFKGEECLRFLYFYVFYGGGKENVVEFEG